jgi:hypothetical protein
MGIVLGVAVVLAIDITNQSTLSSIRQTLERAVGKAELLVTPKGERIPWMRCWSTGSEISMACFWHLQM